MFDVGDLPVLTFGNCVLTKWWSSGFRNYTRSFLRFFRFIQNPKKWLFTFLSLNPPNLNIWSKSRFFLSSWDLTRKIKAHLHAKFLALIMKLMGWLYELCQCSKIWGFWPRRCETICRLNRDFVGKSTLEIISFTTNLFSNGVRVWVRSASECTIWTICIRNWHRVTYVVHEVTCCRGMVKTKTLVDSNR